MGQVVSTPKQSITEHYQTIQALTPTSESEEAIQEPLMPLSTFLNLSLFIFFFVVVFLGFFPLLIERFRNFRRFRTALVVAIISAALPLTAGLMFQRTEFFTKAYVDEVPQQFQIFNVTPNSFSVMWETNGNHYGSLRYGTEADVDKLEFVKLEQGGLMHKKNHEVIVDELTPNTDYYFQIISGGRWYDDAGQLLHVHTLSP